MDILHILEDLAYDNGRLPREAIEEAIVKKEAIIPLLLKTLENAINNIEDVIEEDNYQGHLYAVYLLAQFREAKALPLVIKLFSFSGDIPYMISGDVLTEDLARIFASMCYDIKPIKNLIENPLINEYVRAAAQTALSLLVGCGKIHRNLVINYYKELLFNKLERTHSFVWDNLIAVSCSLYPEELLKEIKQAFQDNLVDTSFISFHDVIFILNNKSKQSCLRELCETTELIDDTLAEMEKWLENSSF